MDPNYSTLLDVLFEGPEERTSIIATPDPKISFPLQDHPYGCVLENAYEPWAAGSGQNPDDSDGEDLLRLLINPNDVYNLQSPAASPETDSGISDNPSADTALPSDPRSDPSSGIIYEVICDTGFVQEITVPDQALPIALENWPPRTALPEACIANQVAPGLSDNGHGIGDLARGPDLLEQLHLTGFHLTDEERRLLSQEGVLLHSELPLTKAEERILKKVRRKIRNKQSAQDSRRRKKEYIDGLESRAAACSAQNQELRKKVHELETSQMSLLDQLQKLQKLIKQASSKAVQTSSCLMILIFSLGLFILPSCTSLLGGNQISQEDYKPSGVISRNILNQKGLSDPEEPDLTSENPELPPVQMELSQVGLSVNGGAPRGPQNPSIVSEGPATNTSALELPAKSQVEPKEGLATKPTHPELGRDPGKQTHTDEM